MSDMWLVSYVALWLVVLALAVLVLLLYRQLGEIYLGTPSARVRDGLAIGTRAPTLEVPDQRGAVHRIPDGRPTLLVFGSPGCGPCAKVMPHLVHFWQQEGHAIALVFVSSEGWQSTRQFAIEHEAGFPVVADEARRHLNEYKVVATPFAFYIDAQGVIRSKGVINTLTQIRTLALRAASIREAPLTPAEVVENV